MAPPSFGPGDLVVVRVGTGAAPLSNASTATFLDEFTATGTLVQTIPMPFVASGSNGAFTNSGTATSEGGLTLSPNGQYLALAGYDASPGTPNIAATSSSLVNRAVAVVDGNGNVDTSTLLDAYSTSNIRGAVTTDGANLWIGGSGALDGGVRYTVKGTTGGGTGVATSPSNVRVPEIFNGQLYVSSGSSPFTGVNSVGVGTPTNAGNTLANIASVTAGGYGYVFLDRDPNIPGPDTLYVADQSQGILKFSFAGSTWFPQGGVAGNFTGITGTVSGSTAVLYATSGSTAGNSLVTLTDVAPSGVSMSATGQGILAFAPTNTVLRGVAFAPVPAAVAPSVTTQPASQTINSGHSATMSVVATGTAPLSYQWYIGNAGDTSTPIAGANAASYATSIVTTTTSYWVRVSNAGGSADSQTATITVASSHTNLVNGCKNSTTPGAEMGHYPAWPGSQSYLRIACVFNHSTNGSGDFVSSTFTIHDFSNVRYHNGAARTFTASTAGAVRATTFNVADCTAATAWVNRGITGPGIAARTFVTSISAGCVVTLNKPVVAPGVAIGNTFLIENSNVRSVTDATLSPVSPMVCSATANFGTGDAVGDSIDGTNITPETTISAIPPAVACPLGQTGVDLNNASTAGTAQTITIGGTKDGAGGPTTTGVSSARTINDGAVVAGPPNTLTSNAARFFNSDIGLRVIGTGITQPCYIASRTNTVATLAPAGCAAANAGPYTFTIGEPSRTAPLSTDTVLNQGAQLPLNPTLVAGSQPCTADNSSGFGIEGTWLNPGSFITNGFATQPGGGASAGTRAVGEILFKTAVVSYAAFVIEVPAAPIGTDPLIGGYHFNLVFPNVPTGTALCPSTPTSPGLGLSIGVNGTEASAAAISSGVGRPATAQFRSTVASTTGSTSTVYITDDLGGGGVKWLAGTDTNFNRTCVIPSGTPNINFICGDG